MEEDEKIILETSGGWTGILDPWRLTSIILTNKRIIMKDIVIPLEDIKNIDIETSAVGGIKLILSYGEEYGKISFSRSTAGSAFHLILGVGEKVSSEWNSYTTYWASMITMAKFFYGKPKVFGKNDEAPTSVSSIEPVDVQYSGNSAWCINCKKYVPVNPSTEPVWMLKCPECDRSGLLSKNPD
jgi:hypothetical protein